MDKRRQHRIRAWFPGLIAVLIVLLIPASGAGGEEPEERPAVERARGLLHLAAGAAEHRANTAAEDRLVRRYRTEGGPIDRRRPDDNTDSLPDARPDAADILLALPRAALYPAYLATEYLIRWPLGRLATFVERTHIIEFIGASLTYQKGDAGFRPIIAFGGGQAGHFGASFFFNDLADGLVDLDGGAAARPSRNFLARIGVDLRFPHERSTFGAAGGFRFRDDSFFFGVGTQPASRDPAPFGEQVAFGRLSWTGGTDHTPGGGSVKLDFLDRQIRCSPALPNDVCGPDTLIGTGDDLFPVDTPGVADLSRDYTFLRADADIFWDSRPAHPTGSGSGVRLEGFTGAGFGVGAGDGDLALFRWGAEVSGYWDVFGDRRRTLGLRLRAEAADPVGDQLIPVPELVSMGGLETMRGFREDRFRGRSALLATVEYRYPVWSFFEGHVFLEVGDVAGPQFRDFTLGQLRGSAGLGLGSIDLLSRHLTYDVNLAIGTAPFASGFDVTEFRINVGTNWGF